MPRHASKSTSKDENKIQVISLADDLIDLADKLDCENGKALAADYADDEPRKEAVRGLDNLHRGLYGVVPERAHAQLTFILLKLAEQEKLDKANDAIKQGERTIVTQIKEKARELRNDYRKR